MAREGKARVLNEEEHKAFMAFLETTRHPAKNKAIYLLGTRAGCRAQSIAGIRLNDVIDRDGKLKSKVELRSNIVKGKRNYAIFLTHEELRTALEDYIATRKQIGDIEELFITQKGTPYTANSISHLLLKLFNDAGFEGASSHSMRRGYATNAIRAGAGVSQLKILMNHRNVSTTLEYIAHNDEELMSLVANV